MTTSPPPDDSSINTARGFLRNFTRSFTDSYDDETDREANANTVGGRAGSYANRIRASVLRKNEQIRKFYDFSLKQAKKGARNVTGYLSNKAQRLQALQQRLSAERFKTLISLLNNKFDTMRSWIGAKSRSNPFLSPLALKLLAGAIGLGGIIKNFDKIANGFSYTKDKIEDTFGFIKDKFGWISDKIEKVVDYSREHSDTIKKYLPIMATVGALIGTKMGRGLLKHGGRAAWRLGKFGAGALWKTGKSVASTIRGNDIAGLVRNIPAMLKSFVSILGSTKIGSMVGGIMGKMAQTGVGQAFTNVIAKAIPSVVVRAFSGPVGWGLLIAQGAKMIWDYVLPQSWKDEIKYQVAKAYIATIDGIKKAWDEFRSWCDSLMQQVSDWGKQKVQELQQVWANSVSFVHDLIYDQNNARQDLKNSFLNLWSTTKDTIVTAVTNMSNSLSKMFNSVFSDFFDADGSVNIGKGLNAWKTKAFNWVTGKTLIDSGYSWAQNQVAIHDTRAPANGGTAPMSIARPGTQAFKQGFSVAPAGSFNGTYGTVNNTAYNNAGGKQRNMATGGGSAVGNSIASSAMNLVGGNAKSFSLCARGVWFALGNAGIPGFPRSSGRAGNPTSWGSSGINRAKDAVNILLSRGFYEISPGEVSQNGDIDVLGPRLTGRGSGMNHAGHIQILANGRFYSDHVQSHRYGFGGNRYAWVRSFRYGGKNSAPKFSMPNFAMSMGIGSTPSPSSFMGNVFGSNAPASSQGYSGGGGSFGGGGASGSFGTSSVGDNSAESIIQFFMSKGWTKEQASGIAANLWKESRFDPNATGDGGKAKGIAQWHPDRQANFRKAMGKSLAGSSLQDQLEFVNYELTQGTERSAGNKLRSARTAQEAGAIVSKYYERPAKVQAEMAERGNLATQMAGGSFNGAGASTGGLDSGGGMMDAVKSIFDPRDEQGSPGIVNFFKAIGDYIQRKSFGSTATTKQDEIVAKPIEEMKKSAKAEAQKTKAQTTSNKSKANSSGSIIGLPNIAEPYHENMYTKGVQ